MTYGRDIPIVIGYIISRNHNDFYDIVSQLLKITKAINDCGIIIENSVLNLDKNIIIKDLGDFVTLEKWCLMYRKINETGRIQNGNESENFIKRPIKEDL